MSGKGKVIGAKWGCDRCTASGTSTNAMALAAQHAKAKGHPTWAEQTMRVVYGRAPAGGARGGLFDPS